jgi:FlaA1/EpsC-like NDP-sugar epimerase
MLNNLPTLDIEDLLGRDAVPPDPNLLGKNVRDKTVLVTGAGGSIGGELCRQILTLAPKRLILLDHGEYNLYLIDQDLKQRSNSLKSKAEIFAVLGSVQDEVLLSRTISKWKPQTVYHAAAYKHVPIVEQNPAEGVRNNVFGTRNIAQLAQNHNVSNFVLVSTDKAVRPYNVMGATKRFAEMILQALAAEGSGTCFSMVRFGNVLDSSGSVVPLFRKQIAAGGPVTVTHEETTRYFMTMREAAQLVIQAGAMAQGGEVFLLNMGKPVKIIELARRMIELSGLNVCDDQNPAGEATSHSLILRTKNEFPPLSSLDVAIERCAKAITEGDHPTLLAELRAIIPDYSILDVTSP